MDKALMLPQDQMGLAQMQSRYGALVAATKSVLKDGVDFGTIPGTDKPTLLKPGAEKLTTLFGLRPHFVLVDELADWDGGLFYYRYRCDIYNQAGEKIADSEGSANSMESRYRWRWVSEDDLPPGIDPATLKTRGGTITEFDFAVDKAETAGKYGKPDAYWQRFQDAIADGTAVETTKKTQAGKTYKAWQISSKVYRIENDDIFTLINTIQKIAQKRALVAAVLVATGASEFFTQDVEDWDVEIVTPAPAAPPPPAVAKTQEAATEGEYTEVHTLPELRDWAMSYDQDGVPTIPDQDGHAYYKHQAHITNTLRQELPEWADTAPGFWNAKGELLYPIEDLRRALVDHAKKDCEA